MGASFGISMVTTLLVRDEQRHQTYQGAYLTATNPVYWNRVQMLTHYLAVQGGAAGRAEARGQIYLALKQQATLLSYTDDFRLLGYLSFFCIPFLFFFRNTGKTEKGRVVVGH